MTISKELLLVLEQGYSAGGEPELAQQLAKALRIKGKLNTLLKIVQDDLNTIWNNIALAYNTIDCQVFTCEALKCAINSLLKNQPMILVVSNNLKLSIGSASIKGIFPQNKVALNRLKNKLNALSVRIQYI
jgi:hypothetical protein